MPSSTSSSDTPTNANGRLPGGPGLRIWLLALVLVFLPVAGLEAFWRARGYRPSVVDDMDLWCIERERVEHAGPDTMVIIGMSRIQEGFVRSVFEEECPGTPPIQLAIGAWHPIAALRDIAENTDFAGLVLCSVTTASLLPEAWDQQEPWVRYYHKEWRLNKKLNRGLRTFAQSHLSILYPGLTLQAAAPDIARGQWPIEWIWTNPDRTQVVDYTKPDLVAFTRSRAETHRRNVEHYSSLEGYARWPEGLDQVEEWVKLITSRGGNVVFLRCVVSGAFEELDNAYFPRAQYWDVFAGHTSAQTIHYEDIPEIADMETAEGSHLFYEDALVFTRALVRELRERNLLNCE